MFITLARRCAAAQTPGGGKADGDSGVGHSLLLGAWHTQLGREAAVSAQATTRRDELSQQRIGPDDLADTKGHLRMTPASEIDQCGDVPRRVAAGSEEKRLHYHLVSPVVHTLVDDLSQARLAELHMRETDTGPIAYTSLNETRDLHHDSVGRRPAATVVDNDDGSDDAHPALLVLAERFASNAARGYS